MSERKTLSSHRGLAPIAFPASWLDDLPDHMPGFAAKGGGLGGLINFGPHGAYHVWVAGGGADVYGAARKLSDAETADIAWGPYCQPWEAWSVAEMFGHGRIIPLDEVS